MQIFSRQIKETQSIGIREVPNTQGFATHYKPILNTISKFSDVRIVKIEKLLNQKHGDPVGDRRIVGLVIISIRIKRIQLMSFSFEVKRLMEKR